MTELKPCPFCHKTSYLKVEPFFEPTFEGYYGFTVVCSAAGFDNTERGCGAAGAWGETEEDASKTWNTRPAAPVEGLERYGWNSLYQVIDPMSDGDYVRFTQAEAIIAAERNRADVAEYKLAQAVNTVQPMMIQRAERAEADNAALTARVKELETERIMIVSHATGGGTDGVGLSVNDISIRVTALRNEIYHEGKKRAEALETQLAADRKALESLTLHANSLAMAHLDRTENNTAIWKALTEARAALEDRP